MLFVLVSLIFLGDYLLFYVCLIGLAWGALLCDCVDAKGRIVPCFEGCSCICVLGLYCLVCTLWVLSAVIYVVF